MLTWRKSVRLRKRREFLAVQGHPDRRKLHARHFLVLAAPRAETSDTGGRLGITVSKKVGTAVVRNRIKRLVREFARTTPGWVPTDVDVVVIAKRNANQLRGLGDVTADLRRLEGRLWAH